MRQWNILSGITTGSTEKLSPVVGKCSSPFNEEGKTHSGRGECSNIDWSTTGFTMF